MKEKISKGWNKVKSEASKHKKGIIATVSIIGVSLVGGGILAKRFHDGDFVLGTEEEELLAVEGEPIEEITELTVETEVEA